MYESFFNINDSVSVFLLELENWGMYNFNNHKLITGGSILKDIMITADTQKFSDIMDRYPENLHKCIQQLIKELICWGFIKPNN
jgi:hypothetical protein